MDIRENSKIFLKNIFKKKVHEMENFQNIKHFFIAAEKFYNHKIDPIKLTIIVILFLENDFTDV